MSMRPAIKGWCPGAHRPMMSGDGLIVRVRPRFARLTVEQVTCLCDLSLRFGNGFMDLTNRANLQLRGIAEEDHDAVLQALAQVDLLDVDPDAEQRRNIIVSPLWQGADLTYRLTKQLLSGLHRLPPLPAKVGIAVDTGETRLLADAPADFRFERSASGLILRADGTALGRVIAEHDALDALVELACWFAQRLTPERRRMAKVVADAPLPKAWTVEPPRPAERALQPGSHALGACVGVPFGQLEAQALLDVLQTSGVKAVRVTPWRVLMLEGVASLSHAAFVTRPGDPLSNMNACPGAPSCASATVETRALARALAEMGQTHLHVSGCAKGCAHSGKAQTTLVGRDGLFDIVRDGAAWDRPSQTGLAPKDVIGALQP